MLLQKCSTELENLALPNHLQLGLFVPLPLPAPGCAPASTHAAAIFGDKDISKCLTNLFVVVERTHRISLASFSDLQCHARDQSCCLS